MTQESPKWTQETFKNDVYEQTSVFDEIKKTLENVLDTLNMWDDCCLFDSERQAIWNEITNKLYNSSEKIKSIQIREKIRWCLIMLLSITDREKTVKEIKSTINLVLSKIDWIENGPENTSTNVPVPVNDKLIWDTKVSLENAAKRNDKVKKLDKEVADYVKDLIEHLPNVSEISIDNKEKIEYTIQEYNNLTDYQKHLVWQDYMKYFLVKKEFERIEEIVSPINELIDSLPELWDVEIYDEYRIKSVKNSYKWLSEDLMRNLKYKKVENLLTIIWIKLLIIKLPDPSKVNIQNSEQIEKAREEYKNLPDDFKEHINIERLINCETELKVREIIESIAKLPEPIRWVIENYWLLIQNIRKKYDELPDWAKDEIDDIDKFFEAENALKRFSAWMSTDYSDAKEQQRIRKKVFSYMEKYKPYIEVSKKLYLWDINKFSVKRNTHWWHYVCITIPPMTQLNETPKYEWEIPKKHKIEFFITESGFTFEWYKENWLDKFCINSDKLKETSDISLNYIEACCAWESKILNLLNDKTWINYIIDLIKQKLEIPENEKIIYDSWCFGPEFYERSKVLLDRNSRFIEDEM